MAVHRAIGTRDPFPYPHLENDNDFAGKKSYQVILMQRFILFGFYEDVFVQGFHKIEI